MINYEPDILTRLKPVTIAALLAVLLVFGVAIACADTNQAIAETIAAEAGGEGFQGMQAVANVIANRARQQHKTPYQIVSQRKQFYGFNAKNRRKLYLQVKASADYLAANIMTLPDITGGATSFENINAFGKPSWAKKMIKTVTINHHTFYRERS